MSEAFNWRRPPNRVVDAQSHYSSERDRFEVCASVDGDRGYVQVFIYPSDPEGAFLEDGEPADSLPVSMTPEQAELLAAALIEAVKEAAVVEREANAEIRRWRYGIREGCPDA